VSKLSGKAHPQKLEEWDVCYGDAVSTEREHTVSGSCPVTGVGPDRTVNSLTHCSTRTYPSVYTETNCALSEVLSISACRLAIRIKTLAQSPQ
jgi:hypothetical protein